MQGIVAAQNGQVKALRSEEVDFLEAFGNAGALSAAFRQVGLRVGEPLKRGALCLGVRWDLSRPETRGRLTWLILKVLRPKLLYLCGVGPWGPPA